MSKNNNYGKDFVSFAPYTEYPYFENLVLNVIDTIEINPEEPLEYFVEIKTGNTKKDNSRKYLHLSEDLQISFSNLEKPTLYFELNFREHSIDFYKKLKYLILMTGNILITLNSANSTSVIEFIKFISRSQIELFLRRKYFFTKINLFYDLSLLNSKNLDHNDHIHFLQGVIQESWNNSLTFGLVIKDESLKIEDFFNIELSLTNRKVDPCSDLTLNYELFGGKRLSNLSVAEFRTFGSNSLVTFKQMSSEIFYISDKLTYLPQKLLKPEDYQDIFELSQIGKVHNDLLLTANYVFKNWSYFVLNGKVIENFGFIVSKFLIGIIEEFEKTLPFHLQNNPNSLKAIKSLSGIVQSRITSLFTIQLLILQTQALDKFKDTLIRQAKHSNKEFEFEKGVAILQVNDWFDSKASKISVPEMHLDFINAKKELQQVLGEVAEKFKDSTVSKLISIQKTGQKTSKGKLKQSGIVVGFGLTAAVKPRGFGNLQIITSYSQGPHVFNFSLVNDYDIAQQEGQSRIKSIRIQPSLNFDIDI